MPLHFWFSYRRLRAGLFFATAVGAFAAAPAEKTAEGWFPFVIPWDDGELGVATDVSFLNHTPAGRFGRVRREGAHFVLGDTGQRIRFLATNLGAEEAFPSAEAAEGVARRLAKHGINLVRLHHLDNEWMRLKSGSIWDTSSPTRQVFSASQLERFDYLVSRLKAHGIYVNLNLKVSKELTEADGFGPEIKDIPFTHQKRVDKFMPRMIALQRDYARALLTHRNPHTGLTYVEDPAVAFVEINNENSTLGMPWEGAGDGYGELRGEFRTELLRRWNDWLTTRYSSDAAVRAAWLVGLEPIGADLDLPRRWAESAQGGAALQFTSSTANADHTAQNLTLTVRQAGVDWQAQALLRPLSLNDRSSYTLRFRARADTARAIRVSADRAGGDFGNVGLNRRLNLAPAWAEFSLPFIVTNPRGGPVRIAFSVGESIGGIELSNVRLAPGHDSTGLAPDGTLAGRGYEVPTAPTPKQRLDWFSYLAEMDKAFADSMRDFLRNDLGVRAPILDSQVQWGGLTAIEREARMDYADTHSYWNHPTFGSTTYSATNWTVDQKPLITELLAGGAGSLEAAYFRLADRPFSVSEYDHPSPQDHAAETVPLAAATAAWQDWDKLYFFAHGAYGPGAANDRIQGFFAQGSNPAKFGFYAGAAVLFRLGLLAPAPDQVTLHLAPDQWRETYDWREAWRRAGVKDDELLRSRVTVAVDATARPPRIERTPGAATTSRLDVVVGPKKRGVFRASAPAAALISGFVEGGRVQAGPVSLELGAGAKDGFATMLVVALDGAPLATAKRALVTLCGRAENPGMVWNEARNSVGDQWGHGPVQLEGLNAHVRVAAEASARVWALDPSGRRREEVPTRWADGVLSFSITPAQATLWWEISR
jgi:hypothetical protein